jgi:hypothetical protein
MIGTGYSLSHFEPSSFNDKPTETTPDGTINVQSFSAYAVYGLSSRVNLVLIAPFEHWRQSVDKTSIHVNNETRKGIGDVNFGLRWLAVNQTTSEGHRVFAEFSVSVPTAESFKLKLFSMEAQGISHNHFAIGRGHYASTVNLEWWHKMGAYPVLLGASGLYNFPLNESSIGFKSGDKISGSLQATILKNLPGNSFPFLKLNLRKYSPDLWDGKTSHNTGGKYIDGTFALFFTLSESLSLISSLDFPLWRNLEGNQMDHFILSFSFRKTIM